MSIQKVVGGSNDSVATENGVAISYIVFLLSKLLIVFYFITIPCRVRGSRAWSAARGA